MESKIKKFKNKILSFHCEHFGHKEVFRFKVGSRWGYMVCSRCGKKLSGKIRRY